LQLNPENEYVRHQLRRLISIIVPFWHARMLNDTRRNDAFERAIQAAVAREGRHARILDIGAGSGLLSMMAARAGAANIVACERGPIIAEAAERIVALNGLDRTIRVISKASGDLTVGKHLEGPADILVSEIISSDLLAENVLDTFQDAHLRLLRKGATIIPRAATAVGCLVESEVLDKYAAVNVVSGFDVSPFTELAPSRLPVHGIMTSWRRLSDDFDLVRIDLTESKHQAVIQERAVTVREDGRAIGVVQWIKLDLADGVSFANHPDQYFDGGWLQVLHTFPKPILVVRGQKLDLTVGHDRISLIVLPSSLRACLMRWGRLFLVAANDFAHNAEMIVTTARFLAPSRAMGGSDWSAAPFADHTAGALTINLLREGSKPYGRAAARLGSREPDAAPAARA
jgi:SAM-dependent methyltransferase